MVRRGAVVSRRRPDHLSTPRNQYHLGRWPGKGFSWDGSPYSGFLPGGTFFYIPRRIPNLICQIPHAPDLTLADVAVVTRRCAHHQRHSERVGAVFLDQHHRIYHIADTLAHLSD